MDFFQRVELPNVQFEVEHQDEVLLLGSCFSDNIGLLMNQLKFNVLYNVFGVMYNPYSIFKLMERALNDEMFQSEELIENDGVFYHFDVHGDLSSEDCLKLIDDLDFQLKKLKNKLFDAKLLVITFGSSWVYNYEKWNKIVANCHKISGSEFNKEILSVESMIVQGQKTITALKEKNKKVELLFTVSPVRHVRDGLSNNHISKGRLIEVATQLAEWSNGVYFPAYELMVDHLRDYRFFKQDKAHPTEEAISYIWEKFSETFISKSSRELAKEIEKLQRAVAHRPLRPQSEAHRQFVQRTLQLIDEMESIHNLDFSYERSRLLMPKA
tara:strand:+ start:2476 stop:3453 length:978 start_codon:yes stop_codon:yes gene_type:complete